MMDPTDKRAITRITFTCHDVINLVINEALTFWGMLSEIKDNYSHEWFVFYFDEKYIDGLIEDRNAPSALAMEILYSCTKPSI